MTNHTSTSSSADRGAAQVPQRVSDTLLIHDTWATRELLSACAALTDTQLDHAFEMGLGTIRATLTHILGAMQGWTDVLRQGDSRPRLEVDPSRTVADLIDMFESTAAELHAAAYCGSMNEMLFVTRNGDVHAFMRAHVVTHITTHSMHHRAQCLNMLRQLGVKPLPKSSVLEWTRSLPGH